ncbi:hypothetical protein [Microbacterium sp. 77mftsu3.1]|uniref:hypothetical protein n=1 Tax=Microbacterium sp. 77mftsu3.1 TaxID=1761802 RepID=UPI0003690A89|nr:hypothetical protein [Microbacterium sp. 77mftsu3.1]SDH55660.1 hypothetical protein SAMN04488590_3568 [Microbacterium sp. 77mftsu3.1]
MPTTIYPIEPAPAFPASILSPDILDCCWTANYAVQCDLVESFGGDIYSGYTASDGDGDYLYAYVPVPTTPERAVTAVGQCLTLVDRTDYFLGWEEAHEELIQYTAYLAAFVEQAAADPRFARRLRDADARRVAWAETREKLAALPHYSRMTDREHATLVKLEATAHEQQIAFAREAVAGFGCLFQ